MVSRKLSFKKVAIIGVGLIGGSLALALKKKGLAKKVIGVARHKRTLSLAKKSGAVDLTSQDLKIAKDADLVILAAPVDAIINTAESLAKVIKKDALVTDVGSTKKKIVSRLENLFSNYAGSHPLAGSQRSGVSYASAEMFKGSLCLVTKTKKTPKEALKKISSLWASVGARCVTISPQDHDRILAFVSHLPHLVAFGLIDLIPDRFLKFGASGLKDTTRIASSNAHLWQEIFISNKKEVLSALKGFHQRMLKFKRLLKKKDSPGLYLFISNAKKKRDNLR